MPPTDCGGNGHSSRMRSSSKGVILGKARAKSVSFRRIRLALSLLKSWSMQMTFPPRCAIKIAFLPFPQATSRIGLPAAAASIRAPKRCTNFVGASSIKSLGSVFGAFYRLSLRHCRVFGHRGIHTGHRIAGQSAGGLRRMCDDLLHRAARNWECEHVERRAATRSSGKRMLDLTLPPLRVSLRRLAKLCLRWEAKRIPLWHEEERGMKGSLTKPI
jgi:hypothetical protein